jgi:hypothetical protein
LEQAAVAIADIEDDAFAMTGTEDDSITIPYFDRTNAHQVARRQTPFVGRYPQNIHGVAIGFQCRAHNSWADNYSSSQLTLYAVANQLLGEFSCWCGVE